VNYAYYDLSALSNTAGDYYQGEATWNYCKFANIPSNSYGVEDTYAFLTQSTGILPMAGDSLTFDDVWQNKTANSVSFEQESETICPNTTDTFTKFTSTIVCDPSITTQGGAVISSVDTTSDPCNLKVTVAHAAGCAEIDASGFAAFIEDYPWVLGTIFVIIGPIIGMVGKRWFPWVVASLAALVTACGLLMVFTVFGWMSATAGFWICLVVSFILAGVAFYFTKKAIWFEIGLLGCVGGWFAGDLLYTFILAATGFDSLAMYIVMEIVIVLICGVLSWKFAKAVVITSTAGIGSYLFVRGWSYFFGGWPTTAQIMESINQTDDFDLGTAFWAYFAIIILSFLFFLFWQIKKENGKDHDELNDFYERQ
jgi:hypothetical protein